MDNDPRFSLAILEEFDTHGTRYGPTADLAAATLKFLQALVEWLRRPYPLGAGQLHAEIGPPEMACVGEACAHDAPVTGRDRGAIVGRNEVRDKDELVGELAAAFSPVMAGLVPAIHAVPRQSSICIRA